MPNELLGDYLHSIPESWKLVPVSVLSNFATVIQTLVVVLAAWFALRQVSSIHATSRRTNTLNLLFENENDRDVIAHRSIFNKLKNKNSKKMDYWQIIDLDQIEQDKALKEVVRQSKYFFDKDGNKVVDPVKVRQHVTANFLKELSENRNAIRSVLNRYEIIAIGIKNNTIDRDMFKMYYRTTTISDWKATQGWIEYLRLKRNLTHAYVEFQGLATEFESEVYKEELATRAMKRSFLEKLKLYLSN